MKSKLLIVEDDLDIREYLGTILGHENLDVATAKSGEEAVEYLKHNATNIVLLDLGLPHIQGDELCTILAKQYPHLKIIVVSARDKPIDSARLKVLGAVDYIAKPFLLDDLLTRIKKYIKNIPYQG